MVITTDLDLKKYTNIQPKTPINIRAYNGLVFECIDRFLTIDLKHNQYDL